MKPIYYFVIVVTFKVIMGMQVTNFSPVVLGGIRPSRTVQEHMEWQDICYYMQWISWINDRVYLNLDLLGYIMMDKQFSVRTI